jgi:BASS family bile acid:Na+ symporter
MNPKVKTYAMPVAIAAGIVFHNFFGRFGWLSPYIIFAMLFVTFTRVRAKELRVRRIHLGELAVQLIASIGLYLLLRWCGVGEIICQGAMICVFVPTAMASVVVGGMLGANVAQMTTFTLLSHLAMALLGPVVFSFVGVHGDMPFLTSFWMVFRRLLLLVVLPFVVAQLLDKVSAKAYRYVREHQQWSFYLWVISLVIVMGETTNFILAQPREMIPTEIVLGVVAGVLCVAQFALGRWWGRRNGDEIGGSQSMGQKNTLLAIILSQSYLNPLASVAPVAYIVWQNLMNSWQLSQKK